MPTTAPEQAHGSRQHVVVGVLRRPDRRLLVQQRTPGRSCAGQWEFPGGKVEAGESPRRALQREIREELGIETLSARPLLALPFDYPHARVWLEVFLVDSFAGDAVDWQGDDHRQEVDRQGREGQPTRWLTPVEIRQLDILGAVHPILDALNALGNPGREALARPVSAK